jgi:hypothetical protein
MLTGPTNARLGRAAAQISSEFGSTTDVTPAAVLLLSEIPAESKVALTLSMSALAQVQP